MLTLRVHYHPHFTVLRCSGRIVHGDGSDTLRRAVMEQEQNNIQIDLSQVEVIDASGLGTLVAMEQWAVEGNRTLQFLHPTKRVREAIETTRLSSVLQVEKAQECDDAA